MSIRRSDQGLPGIDGKTWLSGVGAPSNGLGVEGDFYLNTSTSEYHGPKAAGAWPAGVSLVGPQGPAVSGGRVFYLSNQGGSAPDFEGLQTSPDTDPEDEMTATGIVALDGEVLLQGPDAPSAWVTDSGMPDLVVLDAGTWEIKQFAMATAGNGASFIRWKLCSIEDDLSGETLLFTWPDSPTLDSSPPSAADIITTVQQSIPFGVTKRLCLRAYAVTTSTTPVDVIVYHSGTSRYTRFVTPLVAAVVMGPPGDAATIAVGNVTTGAAGSSASVTNVGTANAAVLDFTIPRGNTGTPGTAATVAVGSVTTGAAGSSASVTNVGTANAAVLDFTIPRGNTGTNGTNGNTVLNGTGAPNFVLGANGDFYIDTATNTIYGPKAAGSWPGGVSLVGAAGNAATVAIGSVTSVGPSGTPSVTNAGTANAAVLDFVLKQGPAGSAGIRDTFLASGSIAIRTDFAFCAITVQAPGGGGASGGTAATAAACAGGGGAGGGGRSRAVYATADLAAIGASMTISIGAAGAGGAGVATNNTAGTNGTSAGSCSVAIGATTICSATGGARGNGSGTAGAGGSGSFPGSAGGAGASGGAGAVGAGAVGDGSGGGGGGGGKNASNTPAAGAAGGARAPATGVAVGAGTAGATGVAGGNGGTAPGSYGGGGGGGGGGAAGANGGNGGNGGAWGAGGGGGGGTTNGNTSGTGGTGGAGFVEIHWY